MSPTLSMYWLCIPFFIFTILAEPDDDCRAQYSPNCLDDDSGTCRPYAVAMDKRCDYTKCCCVDELEDPLLDYLNFQYCSKWSDSIDIAPEVINAIILIIVFIYYLLILGNIADDYFAPIMADTSDTLGISHNIAGIYIYTTNIFLHAARKLLLY